jgi:catechol 2,3-dioxygenase-like lactoylglutathione lyase family enzyme
VSDRSIEVGFVNTDRALVDFLSAVLDLVETDPTLFPGGVIHRLEGHGVYLKVLVPAAAPAAPSTDLGPGVGVAMFTDPDGNTIEINQSA